MLMTICATHNKNALGDGYIGLMNNFQHKEETIVVIPSCYEVQDFDHSFYKVIQEDYRSKGKLKGKLAAFKFYKRLEAIALKEGVDRIFIYSDSEWVNVIHVWLTRLTKIKTTVYIHDPKSHSGEEAIVRLTRKLVYPFYQKKTKVIVSYKKAIQELVTTYSGFLATRISEVKLPGMKVMEFEDLKKRILNKEIDKEYDLLYFGRLEAYKGMDVLLDANQYMLEHLDASPRILILGGRGQLKEEVEKACKAYSNIEFNSEYVSNRELAEYISKSKVVVLPYRDASGTQTVQLANYYYVPVIVNPVGCFSEYVKEGDNGYYIEELSAKMLANKMLEVLNIVNKDDYNPQKIKYFYDKEFDIVRISQQVEMLCLE